jgi:IBR domain, a half RING-finger domain
MNNIIQDDIFAFPELPVLGRCKSEGFETFQPLLKKRKLSEINLDQLPSLNFNNLMVPESTENSTEENWILFPLFDFEEFDNVEVPVPVQKIEPADDVDEELPFFGGFDPIEDFGIPVPNQRVRNPRPPRQPRPPRPPRAQPAPREAEKKAIDLNQEEPETNLLYSLFDEAQADHIDLFYINQLKESPFYAIETLEPYSILCKICINKSTDYYTLDCSHHFCVTCLSMVMQTYVDTSKVLPDDMTCPECAVPLKENVIKKFLSFENYEKLIALRYKIKYQLLAAQGKAIPCPVPDCIGYAHIIPTEKITACNKCRCTLCCLCKSAVHPGLTCEESLKNGSDSALEDLILSQNWKKCPTCGVPVEKIDGCQFLYCDSQICRGVNNLCYICGRFVIEDQHFSHYKTKGPFGDTCNTIDGIPEDYIEPSRLVPVLHNPVQNNPEVPVEENAAGVNNIGLEEQVPAPVEVDNEAGANQVLNLPEINLEPDRIDNQIDLQPVLPPLPAELDPVVPDLENNLDAKIQINLEPNLGDVVPQIEFEPVPEPNFGELFADINFEVPAEPQNPYILV